MSFCFVSSLLYDVVLNLVLYDIIWLFGGVGHHGEGEFSALGEGRKEVGRCF